MSDTYLEFKSVPVNSGFRMEGYWVWCGSVIKDPNAGFHMYAARWPKNYPMFEGYIYLSEIIRAWSPTIVGPYKFVEKILPAGNSCAWNGRMVHNPTIVEHNGKYLLYFIGSTYKEETPTPEKLENNKKLQCEIYNRIKIGMAIADSPSGPWIPIESPILEPRPGHWDSDVVTNPAPCAMPDGRIFLYYRSNTPEGLRIGLAVAESPEGPYMRAQDAPVMKEFNIEDPFVWHNGKCFHMLAKDISGEITGEKIAGAHFYSGDGIEWKLADPPKGYSKIVKFDNGESIALGCLERPQLTFDADRKPAYMFAAAADGAGSFRKALNTWNIGIPINNCSHKFNNESAKLI